MRFCLLAAACAGLLIAVNACAPPATSATIAVRASPSPTILAPSAPAAVESPGPPLNLGTKVVAQPTTVTVVFSGLPRGVYPTHLHSRCSGSAAFHLIVLQNLEVGPSGSGSVQVPTSYSGRGFCVIVYSSRSLTSVIATKQV